MRGLLDPLITGKSPLDEPIKKPKATWVAPHIDAEVEYSSVTEDGLLREPVFKALREDLRPPRHKPKRSGGAPRENILQLLPDAVVPGNYELASYWRTVAKRALPYSCK